MNWNICCCKCTIAHAIMLCVSLRIIFIFTHKWERCVNISAICWHIKHLTTWMRDINKYAERTGAVHEWHQPFLGSLLPLTGYVTMVSSFVLPFYASKLMTSPPCYILSSFSVTLAVRCSCNIISGQPLPYKRGWQCWLPSSALCQVQFSSVAGVWCPPSILWPLAIVAILLLGTQRSQTRDTELQSDHALPPARSWDWVLLISNCC